MIAGLSREDMNKLEELCTRMSPENVCRDGEATETEVNQAFKQIDNEWKAIEKKLGRKISREQIEDEMVMRSEMGMRELG
jgi:hypothetical protein